MHRSLLWRRRCNRPRRGHRRDGCSSLTGGLTSEIRFEILLGDPTADARTLHAAQIDIVLTRHLTDQRRKWTGGFFDHRSGILSGDRRRRRLRRRVDMRCAIRLRDCRLWSGRRGRGCRCGGYGR